jgi:hypothetical protein
MFLLSFHVNSKADGQKLREILMDEIRQQSGKAALLLCNRRSVIGWFSTMLQMLQNHFGKDSFHSH